MTNLNATSSASIEFFESQRLYSLALVNIYNKMGPDYTKNHLKDLFEDCTLSLFPEELTQDNLRATIMNLNIEDVKFK